MIVPGSRWLRPELGRLRRIADVVGMRAFWASIEDGPLYTS